MKKYYFSFIFLFLLGCTTVIEDYIFDGKIDCPKVTAPIGAEEKIIKTSKGLDTYIGFRGVKTTCLLKGSVIKMDLKVNVRVIRKQIEIDDDLPIKISLVSINADKNIYDRDDFNDDIFLKKGSRIIERTTNMSVDVLEKGKVLLGLKQDEL